MNNIMIDLETMGTGPSAAIIAIGAVEFDENSIGRKFYEVVTLESSVANGGVIDPSTVMWWLGQSEEARETIRVHGMHINVVLAKFSQWIDYSDELQIWGNGAGFDNVILETAYQRSGHECPWKFFNNRCYRTVKALYPEVDAVRSGVHHNALDDAITQAQHMIAMRRALQQLADSHRFNTTVLQPHKVHEIAFTAINP